MRTAELDRHLTLEGCFNFRDLGGYAAAGGRRVRWRRLFRADGLHRLSPADLTVLSRLGLATVVDLRTPREVHERGRIEWPAAGLAYHHLPMLDVLPEADEFSGWVEPGYVAARYADMLRHGREAVARAVEVLAEPSAQPAVFHCAAGKDRTGILAALVLGLLGVADEDIVADYALSRGAMGRMVEWIRRQYPDVDLERTSAAMVAAEPDTMVRFLAAFRADHRSFDDYAADLGLSPAVERLRRSLLEA